LFTTYNEKHALANIAYIANDTPPISVANAEKAGRIELRRNGQISQDSFDGEFSSIWREHCWLVMTDTRRPARGFSVLRLVRDYMTPFVAMCIDSSV